MNTNKIILVIAILIVIVLAGLAVQKYVAAPAQPSQNTNVDSSKKIEVQTKGGDVKAQGSGGGTLTICEDKCGDNVCQPADVAEAAGVCAETKAECPQDCK